MTITLTDLPIPASRPAGCDHVPFRHEETGIVHDGHTDHDDHSMPTWLLASLAESEPCPIERRTLESFLVNRR